MPMAARAGGLEEVLQSLGLGEFLLPTYTTRRGAIVSEEPSTSEACAMVDRWRGAPNEERIMLLTNAREVVKRSYTIEVTTAKLVATIKDML